MYEDCVQKGQACYPGLLEVCIFFLHTGTPFKVLKEAAVLFQCSKNMSLKVVSAALAMCT